MNKEQTRQILTILRINYPQTFGSYNNATASAFLDMWAEAFKNDNASDVTAAVKAIIYTDTREFAPNIAQVKHKMAELSGRNGIDADTAWNDLRAVLRSLPSDEIAEVSSIWDSLPKEVRRIYTPADLIDLAFHRTSKELSEFEAPRFKKSYDIAQHQEVLKEIEYKSNICRLVSAGVQKGVLAVSDNGEGTE